MAQAIFLSYASQDADAARLICEALRAAGLEVWFDQSELRGGDAWDASIRKQIKECVFFVPIISNNTQQREEGYFRLEWKLAVDRSHLMADNKAFFFPVILGDLAEPLALVPDKFRERQWTRLNDEAATMMFAERIAKLVAGSASSGKNASPPKGGLHQNGPSNSLPRTGSGGAFGDLAATSKTVVPAGVGKSAGAQVSSSTHEHTKLGSDPHLDHSAESVAHASSGASSGSATAVGPTSKAVAPNTTPRRGLLYAVIALTAVVVVVIAIAAAVLLNLKSSNATIDSVAVLPFENSTGDATVEYLSDGISESLINKLAGVSGLRVISRTSAFSFKGKKMDPMEIGRKLGVDAIVLGTLSLRENNLKITSELVRVSNASQLWGEKYNRQADDVLKVEAEIAATIAQTLRVQLSNDDKAKLTRATTNDPEAYRLYLKGRSFGIGNQRDMDKSVDLLQKAVARAPDYALAHAGLAEAYTRQAFLRASSRIEVLDLARASANRALELDPNLAEAHTALGLIRFYFEWDWAGADAAFRKAIALNAGSSAVHESYGNYLTAMGRLDEGLTRSREAARLDPLSVAPLHDLGINAWARGDLNETVAIFRRAIDSDPNWTWGYTKLSRALATQKKCAEALVQAEAAERLIGNGAAALARSWLGVTYAMCGDTRRARAKLAELHAQEKQRYVDPAAFALIHAALGETNEALRLFEGAYENRTPIMVYASLDAAFDPEFAKQPRYKAILERMKFPK